MHIVNVMQCTNLGGMEQASLRLMTILQKRGHSFEVVSLNELGPLAPLLAENAIPATGVPFRGKLGWRSHLRVRRVVKHIRADALVMTGPTLSGVLALGRLASTRRLLAVHHYHTGVKPRFAWRFLYRLARSRFSAITFPSDFVRAEATDICPEIAEIAYTVRNPLILPKKVTKQSRAEARRALAIPLEASVVGNAGWLIAGKRFDVFLRVAHRVSTGFPNSIFLIAGDGPERESLEQLAIECGISSRIRWLGWQSHLDRFYHAIDVLLFNSDWDALPTTPQEAASFGVPVVASVLHGGLKEIFSCEKVGYLVAAHDVEWLAHKVGLLLSQTELATTLGNSGRDRVRDTCDPDMIAQFHEKLLIQPADEQENDGTNAD